MFEFSFSSSPLIYFLPESDNSWNKVGHAAANISNPNDGEFSDANFIDQCVAVLMWNNNQLIKDCISYIAC